VAIAAYVRKTEGRASCMCAAGPQYECHRPAKNGPAQIATFNDGTVVEQYWVNGARQLKRDLRLSQGPDRDRVGPSTSFRATSIPGW
jgi:hypothetical protein